MFLPQFFRKIIHPLVSNSVTYLAGMVLVRMARKKRTKVNALATGGIEWVEIDNYAGNIKMVVDKHSYMGGSIYWSGYHHLNECLYLKSFLKPEMTFVDAGANQGEFTLFAAKRLSAGKVYSFEPVQTNLESLRRNIALNGFDNVTVVPKGLYHEHKELPIYTSHDTVLNGGRHEGLSTIYPDDYRKDLEQTIELVPFDELLLHELERFDFLKIDIEGAEWYALKGMQQSLEKFHPQILIELNADTAKNAGYEVNDLIHFLRELNYRSYRIFRGKLQQMDWDASLEWGNFVFIHSK
jgi:FkbM family methyltransferase